MFEKNEIKSGLILGLAFPLIGFIISYLVLVGIPAPQFISFEGIVPNFRARTILIVAICLNIIPFRIFTGKRFTDSMRGVILATFGWAFLWVILYKDILFGG